MFVVEVNLEIFESLKNVLFGSGIRVKWLLLQMIHTSENKLFLCLCDLLYARFQDLNIFILTS